MIGILEDIGIMSEVSNDQAIVDLTADLTADNDIITADRDVITADADEYNLDLI